MLPFTHVNKWEMKMGETRIRPSQARAGDVLSFYGYQFKIGEVERHEPTAWHLANGRDYEKLPVFRCYGECLNPDDRIKNDTYFNSHNDKNGKRLPVGWYFQANDNAFWFVVE